MQQLLASPAGSGMSRPGMVWPGMSLRGVGAATRTVQTMGLEWLDYAKQSSDDLTATVRKLAGATTAAETLAIQGAFLREAGERFTARSAVFGSLFAALASDLARPMGVPGASRTP